jgi:anti-sigma factor RsiW
MCRFDDETLMAFADGELDDETSAAVEAALAADPALAERVAALAGARDSVRDLYAPLAEMPVPAALAGRIEAMAAAARTAAAATPGPAPINLAERRAARSRMAMAWPLALAASVGAILAGPIGWLVRGESGPADGVVVGAAVPPALGRALDTVPSGREIALAGTDRVRAIATFQDADGTLCREFEIDRDLAVVAVACRAEDTWRVAFSVEAPLADGYAPASSIAALDAWMDAVSAGQPMSPDEEAAALAEKKSRHVE